MEVLFQASCALSNEQAGILRATARAVPPQTTALFALKLGSSWTTDLRIIGVHSSAYPLPCTGCRISILCVALCLLQRLFWVSGTPIMQQPGRDTMSPGKWAGVYYKHLPGIHHCFVADSRPRSDEMAQSEGRSSRGDATFCTLMSMCSEAAGQCKRFKSKPCLALITDRNMFCHFGPHPIAPTSRSSRSCLLGPDRPAIYAAK